MNGLIITGLLSGLASAMLFAAIAVGNPVGILLFYVASLPLFIAGIGWGWLTAVIGAIAGALAVSLTVGFAPAGAFLITVGLPTAFLAYLALLARTEGETTEWYPVGRLVTWAAGIGAVLAIVTLALISGEIETYREGLKEIFRNLLSTEGQDPPSEEQLDSLSSGMITLLPPVSAAIWLMITLLNLYLAGRIVRASGRLTRPWPDLAAIELPPYTSLVFAGALILATFLSSSTAIGSIALVVAAVLLIALSYVGLGVVHTVTRGSGMRGLVLAMTYIGLVLFGWPILILAAIGIAEPRFRLRDRKNAQMPPPSS